MPDQEKFRFISLLASELAANEIRLPSLPDVVTRIRSQLEKKHCDFKQVSKLVRVDPVLVSRLFVFANSAYHNQTGDRIDSLDAAIARLGFELVRNTAVSLAIKQLFLGEKHKAIAPQLRKIWARSMKLSAMAFALAQRHKEVNEETAFMCGLFHEVGKLYILTKAKDFPSFLGDTKSLNKALVEWHPQIGKNIVEAWKFPANVCESLDAEEYLVELTHDAPSMVDVIYVARLLLDASGDEAVDLESIPSCVKLAVTEEVMPAIVNAYEEKLQSVQQSLAAAA